MSKAFPNTGATVIDSVADLPAASADLEGVMVFQRDSNELKICDGSSWVSMLNTDNPGALQLIATNSFSSASSTQFLNKFSSTYTNYRVLLNATDGSTSTSMMLRFLASNNTPLSGGYYGGGYKVSWTGSGSPDWQNNASSGFVGQGGTSPALLASLDILNPFVPSNTGYNVFSTTNGNVIYGSYYSGFHNNASAVYGVEFYPSTGTITGTASLYGYRNTV